MADARANFHFKLVLLGNAGVGKSCLVLRFIRNEFFEDNETTIGAAFLTKTLALDDSTVKMEVRRAPCGARPERARARAHARAQRLSPSHPLPSPPARADLGHGGAGAVPLARAHVLSRRAGRDRRL
jgi:hypothetical protein